MAKRAEYVPTPLRRAKPEPVDNVLEDSTVTEEATLGLDDQPLSAIDEARARFNEAGVLPTIAQVQESAQAAAEAMGGGKLTAAQLKAQGLEEPTTPEPTSVEDVDRALEETAERLLALEAAAELVTASGTVTDDVIRKAWDQYTEKIRAEAQRGGGGKVLALLNYVPAHIKVLLFRRDHPDGVLFPVVEDSDKGTVAWSYVYLNHKGMGVVDEESALFWDADTKRLHPSGAHVAAVNCKEVRGNSSDHREKAITGAHGRALADLGYGTAFGIASAEDLGLAEENAKATQDQRPQGRVSAPRSNGPQTQAHPDQDGPAPLPRERVGGQPGKELAGFQEFQAKKADRLKRIRLRLSEYVKGRKVVSLDAVEAKYGNLEDMGEDQLKAVHAALVGAKSGKAVDALLGGPAAATARLWRDWPGGSPTESALGFLQAVLVASPEAAHKEHVLEAQQAVHSTSELDLLPVPEQLDAIMDTAVRKLPHGADWYENLTP